MFLFAIREKFGAMAATGIAAAGAIVARFRARHEALVVILGLNTAHGEAERVPRPRGLG